MAKAKLADMTKWLNDGKNTKSQAVQGRGRPYTGAAEMKAKKAKVTIYIPKEAMKMLWYNRAETGESLSTAVEKLVVERFGKKTEAQ